ncbi:MAG: DUF2911 domain-containing protein [Candidatus Koribacter versatilis]|uniref:DUF2911 domain-containing protein n=1 Tax=Candidatus Korobacter versatilis TaxID=658062 RepID=A0A932EP48_9BACT|nr:DUF2911 domain-containing protein [Candidatus Koribacter versatilis]
MRKTVLLAVLLFVSLATFAQKPAPDKSKRPSQPAAPAVCTFADGKTITVAYSVPSMNGRKIFGGLVPFNEVWRTGANEATTFVPATDVVIGGATVPAGSYTLYTLPGEKQWKLILSKKTGQWGIPYPEGQDLGRFDMKTEVIEIPMEKLHISFMNPPQQKDVCTLRIDWEKTRASIEIAEKK